MSDRKDRQLLFSVSIKDCVVQTFRAGGKGGQSQNKTDSGIRVIHEPSGARGESREGKSQLLNKRKAFRRMAESEEFRRWVRLRHARESGQIDAAVKSAMHPKNIKVETYTPDGD